MGSIDNTLKCLHGNAFWCATLYNIIFKISSCTHAIEVNAWTDKLG